MGLWLTLGALGVLAAVSVVGAFLGAERARAMFNSLPLVVFWILLAGLLVAGFFWMPRLVRSPGLAAMHLGALLVLVGGMGGSDLGHRLAARLFGVTKVPHGYMAIEEGDATDAVRDGKTGEVIGRLPFRVGLEKFRIEYYLSGRPKDYFSDLVVLENGKMAVEGTIAMNHPLHWGGYHFYQMDYDREEGRYTILSVRSDSGLAAVYVGFALLVAGAMVRCWVEPAWRRLRGRA